MGNTENMLKDIKELQELKRMKDELDAAIEAAQDKIKAAMGDTETATVGPFKVTYKTVTSNRLDTTKVKAAFPAEVLAPYMTTSTSRPLRIT